MNFESTNVRQSAPKRIFPEPGALALVGTVLVSTGLFGLIAKSRVPPHPQA